MYHLQIIGPASAKGVIVDAQAEKEAEEEADIGNLIRAESEEAVEAAAAEERVVAAEAVAEAAAEEKAAETKKKQKKKQKKRQNK